MKNHSLHPKVREFKEFMEGRPDLKQKVQDRQETLQQLFEEWYFLEEEAWTEEDEKSKGPQQEGNTEAWFSKLLETVASLDGKKWSNIIFEVQGMLEIVQIYIEDLVRQRAEKEKTKAK
ncbi:spore coat protein YlbD [Bacillus sp. B190/17]|uniref:Spore coat protein YlbD n=1 Tax=Bacillus lumedeiriae TaxID=3058829 RepID=A0ABW8I6Q3_9BACI